MMINTTRINPLLLHAPSRTYPYEPLPHIHQHAPSSNTSHTYTYPHEQHPNNWCQTTSNPANLTPPPPPSRDQYQTAAFACFDGAPPFCKKSATCSQYINIL